MSTVSELSSLHRRYCLRGRPGLLVEMFGKAIGFAVEMPETAQQRGPTADPRRTPWSAISRQTAANRATWIIVFSTSPWASMEPRFCSTAQVSLRNAFRLEDLPPGLSGVWGASRTAVVQSVPGQDRYAASVFAFSTPVF